MEITKQKIAAGIALLLVVGFAFGRWSAPEKIKIQKEEIHVDTKTEDKENKIVTSTNREKKFHTVITETAKPDGTKIKKTEIVEDTTTQRNTASDNKDKQTETKLDDKRETKEIDNKKPSLALHGLVGTDITNLSKLASPIFGAAIDKNIFGPIGAGVWGLSNGTCGVSVGIQF